MSNDRDDRDDHNDEPEDRGGERIATATPDHSLSTDREPMLTDTGAKTKDPADIKLAPPKSVGDHKDGVLTEDFKEPKGHEIGGLDDVAEGPGRALHEDLTSQIDQVGAHETLMDAPGADLLQGRDGGLPEGVASMPGGGHDTSGRTKEQESPIDMSGPGGAGGTGGSADGGPGGLTGFDPKGDKPGKSEYDYTIENGSKENAKDLDGFFKHVNQVIKDQAGKGGGGGGGTDSGGGTDATGGGSKGGDGDNGGGGEPAGGGDSDPAPEAPAGPEPAPDDPVETPTDPEYDGPMGISGVQTEAFKNEYLQSQWNAKQDSTINPNPSSDASLEQVEMFHAMDDMVTTPADSSAGGPPKLDSEVPLADPNQPIDFGEGHIEPGDGSGPYDDNLTGDLFGKVPKLPQSTGGNTSTTDDDEADDDKPIVATTNKMTKDAPEEAPDKDAEKGGMQKEHTPDETPDETPDKYDKGKGLSTPGNDHYAPDKYDTAESADVGTVDPGQALGGWDGVVTDGSGTVVTRGGDESGAGQSKFDHSATASGSPEALVTEYGAGHVLQPKPAFGQGDVTIEAPGPLPHSDIPGNGSDPWGDPYPDPDPWDPGHGPGTPTDGESAGSGLQVTELPTTDDSLLVRRSSDSDDSGNDTMEYDPGLEPLE